MSEIETLEQKAKTYEEIVEMHELIWTKYSFGWYVPKDKVSEWEKAEELSLKTKWIQLEDAQKEIRNANGRTKVVLRYSESLECKLEEQKQKLQQLSAIIFAVTDQTHPIGTKSWLHEWNNLRKIFEELFGGEN